jgi:hypothetical protein
MFRSFKEWLQLRLEQGAATAPGAGLPSPATPNRDLASKAVADATADMLKAKPGTSPADLTSKPQYQSELMKKATQQSKQINPAAQPKPGDIAAAMTPDEVAGGKMRKK